MCYNLNSNLWIAGLKIIGGINMKKKVLAMLCAGVCVFGMTGCGEGIPILGMVILRRKKRLKFSLRRHCLTMQKNT